jgi:hypothetical protein
MRRPACRYRASATSLTDVTARASATPSSKTRPSLPRSERLALRTAGASPQATGPLCRRLPAIGRPARVRPQLRLRHNFIGSNLYSARSNSQPCVHARARHRGLGDGLHAGQPVAFRASRKAITSNCELGPYDEWAIATATSNFSNVTRPEDEDPAAARDCRRKQPARVRLRDRRGRLRAGSRSTRAWRRSVSRAIRSPSTATNSTFSST